MQVHQLFLSCDWGTSSLRIRLVETASLRVIAEECCDKGIRDTYLLWKDSGEADAGKRIAFYLDRIGESIRNLAGRLSVSLEGVPLLLSGMASSSAGMAELPYRALPFLIDRDELITRSIPAGKDFSHPVLLISGLTNGRDVMRGEEVQLIGCLQGGMPGRAAAGQSDGGKGYAPGGSAGEKGDASGDREVGASAGDGLYIFPGTHSKHILVKERAIVDFTTYMTGEFFGLLSQHSLLSGSVEAAPELPSEDAMRSFRQGVLDAVGTNLLHAAFRVRTNDLFGTLSKKENFHYLSGLLIGTELQALAGGNDGGRGRAGSDREGGEENNRVGGLSPLPAVYLCCGAGLKEPYERALEALGLYNGVHIFSADLVDKAVVSGQSFIFNQNRK